MAKKTAPKYEVPVPKTKFADFKVGETFEALSETFVKVGPLEYRSVDNPSMGEYQWGPVLDKQIGVSARPTITGAKAKVTKDPEVQATEDAIRTPVNVKRR